MVVDAYFFEGSKDGAEQPPRPKQYTMSYDKQVISEEVLQTWRTTVAPHFRKLDFVFTINEDDCRIFLLPKNPDDVEPKLVARARNVFSVLACGLSSSWVQPVLEGTFYCNKILYVPRTMSGQEELEKLMLRLEAFWEGFSAHKLSSKWNRFVRFVGAWVKVLATTPLVVDTVGYLVSETLTGDVPFESVVESWRKHVDDCDNEDISQNKQLLHTCAEEERAQTLKSSVNLTGSEHNGRHLDSNSSSSKVAGEILSDTHSQASLDDGCDSNKSKVDSEVEPRGGNAVQNQTVNESPKPLLFHPYPTKSTENFEGGCCLFFGIFKFRH